MAHQTAAAVASLRALTYRITATPTAQLPKIASQIAGSIWTCRHLLSAPNDTKRSSNDAQTAVHRFKTQLSTLLQDRTVEGRWAAVVLVKASIEAGGVEVLSKCNPWVRSLLGFLKKPDPPSTRTLAVLTLTRIFTLTWENSTLVREITTPALTAFIPTCLANLESKRCSPTERQTIFDAFATLLPRHPTLFRTNEHKLRAMLSLIISSTSTDLEGAVHYNEAHRSTAAKLWVLLNDCAPKSGAADKWNETFSAPIRAAHATCDRIFRAVQEEWQSTAGILPIVSSHEVSSGEVETAGDDAAGLIPWKGVYAGSERLIALLGLLKSHISTATPGLVSVRIGNFADLLTRLFGVTIPTPGKADSVKFNNQIARDEREAMFTVLPSIHIAAFDVAVALLERLDKSAISWVQSLLEQCIWVFRAESSHDDVRRASYKLLTAALNLSGPSMSKIDVADLEQVLKACCQDVLPVDDSNGSVSSKGMETQKQPQRAQTDSESMAAAQALLQTVLSRLDSSCITPKVRALIDRAGVLTKNKETLLSSVMNAPKKQNSQRVQASMLPILASQFPNSSEVESLLRPRMPPISSGPRKLDVEQTEEDDEEEVEEDDSDRDEIDDVEEHESDPAAALLDALAQDTTMSTSDVPNDLDPDQTLSKRKADEGVESELSAKRLRALPVVAENLMPESMSTSPGPEHLEVSETVVVGASRTKAESQAKEPSKLDVEASQDAASDDSDFEMPPLTMEPDTDPEDDD